MAVDNTKLSRAVARGVKWTTISAIFTAIAKLAQVAILTRFLSKADFGLIAIALLVNSFCAIFMDMGVTTAVLHKIKISKEEYSSLYWLNIVSGLLLTLLAFVFSPLIANYYNEPELRTIIQLLSLNIFFSSLSGLQRTMQQKKMNFKFISVVEMFSALVMLASALFFALMGIGIYSMVYSTLINGFIIACIYLFYGIFFEKNIMLHCNIFEILDSLKIGIYQVGSSILDFFSSEMDTIIISLAYSFEILGVYTLCKQIVLRVYTLVTPIVTKVLTPFLSLLQQDKPALKHEYVNTLNLLSFVNFPIYFLIAYGANVILSILYGNSYGEYSYILLFLAINYAIMSLGNPVGSLIVATGKTRLGFFWTIYRVSLTLVFFIIMSQFSIGVFAASICVLSLLNLYPHWFIVYKQIINIRFKELAIIYIKPLTLCLLLYPVSLINQISSNIYINSALLFCVFTLIYLGINYFFNKQNMLQTLFLIKSIIVYGGEKDKK